MKVHLLFALPHDQVLEEVNGKVGTGTQICLHIHGEEDVDLPLGAELGRKRRGSHCCLIGDNVLHEKILFCLILQLCGKTVIYVNKSAEDKSTYLDCC